MRNSLQLSLDHSTNDKILEHKESLLNGGAVLWGPFVPTDQIGDMLEIINKLQEAHQLKLKASFFCDGDESDELILILLQARD